MRPTRLSWRARFAFTTDVVFAILVAFSGFIELRHGVRWRGGGLFFTAKSGVRALVVAVLLLVFRHAVLPRPSILERLFPLVRRIGSVGVRWTHHAAAVTDVVLVSLAGFALLADLLGGLKLRVGDDVVLRSGADLALAVFGLLLVRMTFLRRVPSLGQRLRTRLRTNDLLFEPPPSRELIWAVLVYCGATTYMLREQLVAYTHVPDLGDPLFSMWRLAWVAHQLPLDPRHLFDANIFHPAARTLAYSDAMLLPAFMAAPALWLGAAVAPVYTSLLLFSYVAAGVGMFVLVRAVTRQAGAAYIAGLVFAFDPFRFLHYSHLELQFTFCMPLAVFFLLRTLSRGTRSDAVLTGIFVALQGLASLYYVAYFVVSLFVFVLCWVFFVKRIDRRTVASLGLAAAIASAVCVPITLPYWENRATLGERGADEVRSYSASGRDYFTAYRQSVTYGTRLWDANNGERKLFPGALPIVLGAAALAPPVEPLVAATAVTLAVSVDASLGLHGTIYTWLYDFLPPFRGFRAPARFRAIAGLYLAVLIGFAIGALGRRIQSVRSKDAMFSVLGILLLFEAHPRLELQPLWNHAPGIYQHIPDRHAVVADLPIPWDQDPFWHDSVYMYFSTFHWHPIINGTSGFGPSWYDRLGALSRDFPSDDTLDAYRQLGTEYIVLHEGYYRTTFSRIVAATEAQPRLQFVATSTWEEGECRLYRLLW
jgi:hypothetical protein